MADGARRADRVSPADMLGAACALARVAFRAAPGRAVAALLLEPAGAVAGALMALWLKFVADAAASSDGYGALLGAAALAGSFGLSRGLSAAGIRLRMGLQERVAFALEQHLARAVAASPGLEPFERPEHLDRLTLLRQQRDYFWFSLNAVVQGLREVVRLVGSVALLATVAPLLLLLPLLGVPAFFAGVAARRLTERAAEQTAESERLAGHLLQAVTTAGAGREVRVFGLAGELERRWTAAAGAVDATVIGAEFRAAVWQTAAWLVFVLGFVGAVALVAMRAMAGQATAGDALLVLTLAGGVAGNVQSVATWTGELVGALRFLARYVAVIREVERAPSRDRPSLPAPSRLEHGITMEGLRFRYSGTGSEVLRGIDLRLPAGSVVALVGDNGAGKTTLVKLLLRFYEPTAGRIRVDGTDLADIDLQQWRARSAAGFQDFARLELLAQESVGVGDLPRAGDELAVLAALDRAGAADVVGRLERGLQTQLGRTWGGTDLSGGQWQKLALGRAMMRERPLLLVLDEPTASLDAETEHALFERYAQAARARSADGAITVLVSHRFSTVRMADLIVVLDDGRVAESGTHAELIARGGLYAGLYELQARAYR